MKETSLSSFSAEDRFPKEHLQELFLKKSGEELLPLSQPSPMVLALLTEFDSVSAFIKF